MTDVFHEPVMVSEVLTHLLSRPREVIVDCTVGDGGHSLAVLRETRGTFLVGLDVDEEAVSVARGRLGRSHSGRFVVTRGDYRDLPAVLARLGIPAVDGTLHDLGVSSRQLGTLERGFSYWGEGPLDMRMSRESGLSARDIVNTWSEAEIRKILRDYGEERHAARIARGIVLARKEQLLATGKDLVEVIRSSIPGRARRGKTHPARRTFQALRIATNDELSRLGGAVQKAFSMLRPGGVSVVISYHSLEDRIVKETMKSFEDRGVAKRLQKRPETASEAEIAMNARARSAKLRAIEKTNR